MCIAVSIHDTVYRSEVNFGVVIFFGILGTIEGDDPEISHPSFFFCSRVRPGNPSLSASDPFALSRGTGCPAFGRF